MFYVEIMLKYVLWNQTVFACFMDQVQREFDEVFLLDYRLVAPHSLVPTTSSQCIRYWICCVCRKPAFVLHNWLVYAINKFSTDYIESMHKVLDLLRM